MVCNTWSHTLEFGWVRVLLANGQEKNRSQHMESCTLVWVGKTSSLLISTRKVVRKIRSNAHVANHFSPAH